MDTEETGDIPILTDRVYPDQEEALTEGSDSCDPYKNTPNSDYKARKDSTTDL